MLLTVFLLVLAYIGCPAVLSVHRKGRSQRMGCAPGQPGCYNQYPAYPVFGYVPSNPKAYQSAVSWCGQTFTNETSGRIINGEATAAHEFPWMTKITVDNYFFCGGSLIASNYVLTAGHCVASHKNGLTPSRLKVELGAYSFVDDRPPVRSQVVKIILHPEYDVFVNRDYMMQTNDIALLRIMPVPFSEIIAPICLPRQGEVVPDGTMLTVAGWGVIREDGTNTALPQFPTVLMKNTMKKISWRQCRSNSLSGPFLEPEYDLTDSRIICMLGSNTDACQGDSGGGAIQRTSSGYVIQGIVSWGIGCNVANFPSAYTRVASYVNFIHSVTRDALYLPMKPPGDNWRRIPKFPY